MVLTLGRGAWLFGQAAPEGIDWGTALLAYGVAAPFAALCLWLLMQARHDLNEERKGRADDTASLRAEIGRLQDERLLDAQRALAGFGTRLHDTAVLVERGTRVVAEVAPTRDEFDELRADLRDLADGLRRSGLGGDRGAAPEARRGLGEGAGDGRGGRSWEGT